MTEAAFIKLNLSRWQEFEKNLEQPAGANPDRLKQLYLQLTDDLAYAETNFPQGEITQYLHNLTARVHKRVYRNKRQSAGRLVKFWTREVPEIAARHQKVFLYSTLIFCFSIALGSLSALNDDTFARLIMSDRYIDMTEENIANQDPMAVYKDMRQSDMFMMITVNNIRVSLTVFALGILTSVASGLMLFYNGVMLGAFQTFFYQKQLFLTSLLTIWIHGTLEISALIIAGAAGMILGNSIVFPGTLPRMESFKKGARDGLKLVIGLVPIFVVAGFLESYVTRLTDLPNGLKALIILASAAFIIYYFVVYPLKFKNHEFTNQQN